MLRQVSLHGPELLPIITTLGIAFVTIVGVKTFLGVTFGGMFITLAGFLLPHSRAQSSANIEAGPLKVSVRLESSGIGRVTYDSRDVA